MPHEIFPRRRDSRSLKPSRSGKAAASRRGRATAFERLEGRAMLAALPAGDATEYVQSFDAIGTGLPEGWTVRTGATSSALGTAQTFTTSTIQWADTAGRFKNFASADGSAAADATATQAARVDRALGIRQSSFGDPGAAFVFEIDDTRGRTGFSLDLSHQMLSVQTRSTVWSVQYSVNGGTEWTTVGTYADPAAFGSTPATYSFGAGLDDLSTPVFIRVAALSGSTGSGSRDSYGIDDVRLTWTNTTGVPGITATGAGGITAFTTIAGTPSTAQSFAVSGANLSADILVTAPTNFEVSTDNTSFGPTATLAQSGGAASGTVYVRIAAGAAQGAVAGNVVLSSTDAASVNVGVTGSVRPVVVGLPYGPETFDTTTEPWFTYSVAGGQNWTPTASTRGVASGTNQVWQISGFDAAPDAVAADDWLMIGPFDFTNVTNPTIAFSTLNAFTADGFNVNELSLKASTAYAGSGDPLLAAWSTIPFPKPLAENTKTPTGQVPLAGMAGQAGVYVAFHYVAGGTVNGASALWQVDDVNVFDATSLALGMTLPTTINEGTTGGQGRVRIPAALGENLTVTVTSADPARLLLHNGNFATAGSIEVTILAGQTEQVFFLDAVRNFEADQDLLVAVTATATGYDQAAGSVTVRNIDLPSALLTGSGYTQDFASFAAATPSLPQGWSAAGLVTSFNTTEPGQVIWGEGVNSGYRGGANVFGYQHTSSTVNTTTSLTFQQVLTLKNDTGATITDLTIGYLGRVARADQTRSPAYTVTVNGVAVPGLAYSTLDGDNVQRTATVSGLSIPVGQTVEIVWSSDRGLPNSGSSKQIGISGVSVASGAVVTTPTVAGLSVPLATIGTTSAAVAATVSADGGATVTARGFVVLATSALTGELTLDTPNAIVVTDGLGTGAMAVTLTGLTADTGYTIRAYATNSEGTVYTAAQTFTTESLPAALTGTYRQPFADYSGTLPTGWKAISSGGAQTYGGGWGTGSSAGFRGVGTGTGGVLGYQHTSGSGDLTVTLKLVNDSQFTVETLTVSYLGRVALPANTRFPAWTVSVNGSEVPALAYSTGNTAGVGGAAGDQQLSATLENLAIQPGDEVTITWVSSRDSGQASGSSRQIGIGDVQVTARTSTVTGAPALTLDAQPVSGLGATTARISGSVSSTGGTLTSYGVVYAPSSEGRTLELGAAGVTAVEVPFIALAGFDFDVDLTGLSALTGYDYRAFATNAAGTTYTDPGTFTTTANPPTVTVAAATDLTAFTATLGGSVTGDGGGAISERGVVWAAAPFAGELVIGAAGATKVAAATAATGDFGVRVTGLTPSGSYVFRTFATNSGGTTYSEPQAFSTPAALAQWTFDTAFDAGAGPVSANTGTGTASLVGGTTHVTSTTGVWRVTTFPAQSAANGTAGVEFRVSTAGRQNVVFSFDHYGSGTASRWAQVDYTVDGGANWVTGFWNNGGNLPDGPYTPFRVDFSGVAAANDNPDFGVRVVSIFSPQAFNENSVTAHGPNAAYMRINAEATYPPTPGVGDATRVYAGSGNWRFENVTVSGESLPATTPTVSTPTSAAISTETARLGGTVVTDGFAALTARGVVIAPASFVGDLLVDAQGVTVVPAATAELGTFTVNASGLALSTNYRFRAYATNAGGFTAYSEEGSFQTLATVSPPVVSAPTATAVTGATATLGGTVEGDGGRELTAVGVVFSSTLSGDALVVGAAGATVVPAAALGTGVFTVAASGLSELTTYTYRVFATNSEGTSYTAAQTFSTAGSATVATTPGVSGVTGFTATLAGTATAGSAILERGFVLALTATNAAPELGGTAVTQVVAEPGDGGYTAVATRLKALSGYSFRAYATTAAGTTYGDVATFATAEGAIAYWDFAGDTTLTAGGVGTAGHVGGTTEAAQADAWRVTNFPAQEVGSGTAGVQFLVPTVGYSDIVLSFRHYASNTGSRWAQLDYTLDGGQTWTTGFWNNAGVISGEAYYPFTVDFTAVAGAANNPDFGVRIVSIFSPVEFNPGVPDVTYAPNTAYHRGRLTGGTSGYAGTGNWRFQNVTVTGTALTAQAPILTVANPTVVKGTSATLGGAVVSGGGRDVTTRGVLVAPSTFSGTLELNAPGVFRFDAAAGGLGSFTAAATGLDLSTAYVYRAFATNADGLTGYSATGQFTTLAVDLISTTTTLDPFPAQATFGTPVTFTGTVSAVDSAQTPSGTVQIRAGGPTGTLLASATVAGDGTYSAASSSIGIGAYSGIAAYFLVGGTFDGSSSAAGGSLTIAPRPFTPGNLLVLRVGDGTSTLGVTADAVTLVEFAPDGTLVQAIPVAAAGSGALTLGTNPNNGILSLAADRQSVTFGGYRTAAGSVNPVPANVPRVIGSVGADGEIDTSRAFAGVFTSEDFRSVATDDGSNFWLSGAGSGNSGGIRHVADGGTSLTGLLAAPPADPNMRQVLVIDGNLFTASGSNPTGRSIYQVGTGLPTTAGQPLVNVLPIGGSSQWQSFYFADLDPAVSWGNTGFDTIYATDLAAVTKLSYEAGDAGLSWVDRGSVVLAGVSGITGFTGGNGTVTLYLSSTTANTGGISTIIDSSGAGGTLSATAANLNVAAPITAGSNYAFRGIAFVPRAGIDTTAAVTAISSTVTQNFLQEVTFTATVTAATGSAPPTGVVQFRSGGVLLATATLTGSSATATATVATTAIPFGTYTGITARYIPDGNASANLFNPSVSAAFGTDLVVEPQGEVTTTTITSITPLTAAYGDTVTFSGTVAAGGGGSASGTVQIRAGGASGTLLASGSVTGGSFSVSSTTIPGGSYGGIVAVFSGVAGFQNSVSAAFQGTLEVSFTTLTAGDIAFTGLQPAAPESLSFVLLRDVIAGTTLTITDNPWDGSALGGGEGTSTITFTQAFAAGTVFEYLEYDLTAGDIDGQRWAHGGNTGSISTTGVSDVTSAGFGLSTSGDNLFAYQGAAPTTGSAANWIAGFSTQAFLTTGTVSGQTSYLPTALAAGNAGISLGLAAGDASGQGRRLANLGSVSGTPTQIRGVLADPTNWVVTTSASDFTSTTTFVVDTTAQPATAPKVTGLFVRGSTWADDYLDLDVFTTVGSSRLGWQLPDGSAQLANGSAVPWVNVDTFSVRFSEPVQLPAVDAMRIVRGNPNGNSTTTPASRQLLEGGTVVQWTFADAVTNGRYFVSIPSAGVTNAAGTAVLDGEWVTSQSTFATGSGNGTAGGIFNFGFMVLRGNVSGQGSVQASEVLSTRSQIGQAVSAANYRFAITGQRSITGSNFLTVRSQSGNRVSDFTAPTAPTELGGNGSLTGFSPASSPSGSTGGTAAPIPSAFRLMADPPAVTANTPVPAAEASPSLQRLIARIPAAVADSPASPATASGSVSAGGATGVDAEAWAWFAIESEQAATAKKK